MKAVETNWSHKIEFEEVNDSLNRRSDEQRHSRINTGTENVKNRNYYNSEKGDNRNLQDEKDETDMQGERERTE